MFKVGDIVECVVSSGSGTVNEYVEGHLYRVVYVSDTQFGQVLETVGITVPEALNGWGATFFKLAKPKRQRNLPSWW